MAAYEAFKVERTGHVAEVILTGPGKGNAMGPAFFRELPEVFAALDKDESVRAVVVRGDNANFSYGLDLRTMAGELMPLIQKDNLAAERLKLLELIGDLQKGFDLVARCRKPVIAAVAGACIGGGDSRKPSAVRRRCSSSSAATSVAVPGCSRRSASMQASRSCGGRSRTRSR